jgi:hypothetical protein
VNLALENNSNTSEKESSSVTTPAAVALITLQVGIGLDQSIVTQLGIAPQLDFFKPGILNLRLSFFSEQRVILSTPCKSAQNDQGKSRQGRRESYSHT